MDADVTGGGAISLGSQVGEMMSGLSPSEPAPEAAESADASGAPPTEPSAPAESTETTDEPSATPAEAEPSGAEPSAAEPAASKEPEAVDPLKDAKPLTYTVDGQMRTYEGIKVLGEDGAIVDAAALPDLMRRLGERDHLVTANQQLFRDHDTLTKLTTWTTEGPDGKPQTYTGPEAIVESRAASASQAASLQVLAQALLDPVKFARLVAADEKNQVVLNPGAREALETQMELAADRAAGKVRADLAAQIVRAAAPSSAVDYATEGPRLIGLVAQQFKLDAAKLSADDRAALIEMLPNFIEKDGKSVSAVWQKEVKRAIDRATQVASITTTVKKADQDNAARLAAAARGKAKPAPAPTPAKPPTPTQQRAADSGDAWDRMEKAAAKAVAGAR